MEIYTISDRTDVYFFSNNKNEILHTKDWTKTNKHLDSKTKKPKIVSCKGKKYQLIEVYERKFSYLERLNRFLIGIHLIIRSFGKDWKNKRIKELFKKKSEKMEYAIEYQGLNFSQALSSKTIKSKNIITKNPATDKKTMIDSSLKLDPNTRYHILSFLDGKSLSFSQQVNKKWREVSDLKKLWSAIPIKKFVGKEAWKKFGDVGNEPALPPNIHKILSKPCPLIAGKIIAQTHVLVLIPETINGEKAISFLAKQGKNIGLNIPSIFLKELEEETRKSRWVLMTCDWTLFYLPCKTMKVQYENFISHHFLPNRTKNAIFNIVNKTDYQAPSTLDVIICLLMNPIKYASYESFYYFKDNRTIYLANKPTKSFPKEIELTTDCRNLTEYLLFRKGILTQSYLYGRQISPKLYPI